ncbi:MAG TPA: hypothetical protein PLD10_13660 [Rhodopila sp.]|nr:hypothetical protein [Rhodopila sp.]
MAVNLASLVKFVSPRRKSAAQGVASPPPFNPAAPSFRQVSPIYRDHLIDIGDWSRIGDSMQLMELLASADPDTSAAVHAYLTLADQKPQVIIKDINGEYHEEAYRLWDQMVAKLTRRLDLSQGYQERPSLRILAEQFRYMLLLRGACAAELVAGTNFVPNEIRQVDPHTLWWFEPEPGKPWPQQWPRGSQMPIDLNIPTFFISRYRNSPLTHYSTSPFVSAINTIAARQEVVNSLYRILNLTGFPRIDIKVLETVLQNAAPANIRADSLQLRTWIEARIQDIRGAFSQVRPDEAFVHTDATEVTIINDKNPGVGIDIKALIGVLNAQNQAGLKAVSTILGRGESGVNTASVEARVFSMNADSLNAPVGELLSNLFSCAYQLLGYPVIVSVEFPPAELRPLTELEPQLVMRQTRLLEVLSLGLVTDEEFHIQMFGRMPPVDAPKLSGTNFLLTQQAGPAVDKLSPNNDPLGRSLAPEGSSNARSNRSGGPGSAQDRAKNK